MIAGGSPKNLSFISFHCKGAMCTSIIYNQIVISQLKQGKKIKREVLFPQLLLGKPKMQHLLMKTS